MNGPRQSIAAALVLLLALWLPAKAAETEVGLGIKGGVLFSTVKWSMSPFQGAGETSDRRLVVGLLAEVGLGQWFAVQPELNYVTMGYSWSDSLGYGIFEETFQYLHVPVLFKVRLARKGWIVPAVFAGPSVGFLLRARLRYYEVASGSIYYDDVKDLYRNFDLGAAFGAGANVKVRNLRLLLDIRYHLGLTDVFRSADGSVKPAGWMLTGGLGF